MEKNYTKEDIKNDKSWLPYKYHPIKCSVCGKTTEFYYVKWFGLVGKPKKPIKCVICSVSTIVK